MHFEMLAVREIELARDRPVGQGVNAPLVDDAHLGKNFGVDHALPGQLGQVEPVALGQVARLHEPDGLIRPPEGANGMLLAHAAQVEEVLPGFRQLFDPGFMDQRKHHPPRDADQDQGGDPQSHPDSAVVVKNDGHGVSYKNTRRLGGPCMGPVAGFWPVGHRCALPLFRMPGLSVRRVWRPSLHGGSQPGQHLQGAEGFDEIGVGAVLAGNFAVRGLAARRHHGHQSGAQLGIRLDHFQHIQAVLVARHHHIQQHGSGTVLANGFQCMGCVVGFKHVEFTAQHNGEQTAYI